MVLAYRHAFHAGGPADVLKHVALVALCRALRPRPVRRLVDTHAGAAWYPLLHPRALKNGEHEVGVVKLLDELAARPGLELAPALAAYAMLLRAGQRRSGELNAYPGSPLLAAGALRGESEPSQDGEDLLAELYELHGTEVAVLRSNLARRSPPGVRWDVRHADGLARPPKDSGDTVVVVDPAYEVEPEYRAVAECVGGMRQAAVMVWMPRLRNPERAAAGERMREALCRGWQSWQLAQMDTEAADGEVGMFGSAVLVGNPPPGLVAEMKPALEQAAGLLGHKVAFESSSPSSSS